MRFEDLTTEEVAAAARDSTTVVLLPVGSIEPHGPHLPLSTDILIADETARRAVLRLEGAGLRVLTLPTLAYATVEFSAGFAGAIGPTADDSERALESVLVSLARQGFDGIAIVNAHLEPAHVQALRSAVAATEDRTGVTPIFPDITRRALAAQLTEEFRSGACHAGRYETSLVLAVRPDLVKEEVRRRLPKIDVSLVEAIGRGERTFLEAGLDRAYCGDPAAATAEEGQQTFEILSGIVTEEVLRTRAGTS